MLTWLNSPWKPTAVFFTQTPQSISYDASIMNKYGRAEDDCGCSLLRQGLSLTSSSRTNETRKPQRFSCLWMPTTVTVSYLAGLVLLCPSRGLESRPCTCKPTELSCHSWTSRYTLIVNSWLHLTKTSLSAGWSSLLFFIVIYLITLNRSKNSM